MIFSEIPITHRPWFAVVEGESIFLRWIFDLPRARQLVRAHQTSYHHGLKKRPLVYSKVFLRDRQLDEEKNK